MPREGEERGRRTVHHNEPVTWCHILRVKITARSLFYLTHLVSETTSLSSRLSDVFATITTSNYDIATITVTTSTISLSAMI